MIYNKYFLRCMLAGVAVFGAFDPFGASAANPRSTSGATSIVRDSESAVSPRTAARSATNKPVVARAAARSAVASPAARNGTVTARSAVRTAVSPRSTTNTGNAASNATTARSATAARATAVFTDISKIGGGYAQCRDSYATCMDQFCAAANDKYRRCFCSSKFTDFQGIELALDKARTMLASFEDNNLNAVDKTAGEVNAMYSASIGEAAIKKDTSAAAKLLNEIGDLLAGKKQTSSSSYKTSSLSMGVMSLDLSADIGDIWSDSVDDVTDSVFANDNYTNISELEGLKLYNAAHSQCVKLVSDSCENTAVANMARSAYGIMITQDCNAYQKSIDKQVENVKQTVRTAEKYLRQARLEEYRAHNSQDVNDCIAKVREAVTSEEACGPHYKHCLDYTGAYINASTGEPIYSPRLFKLTEIISLNGTSGDVLAQNPDFNNYLDSRKMFANTALDSCRSISATVWEEFKRAALIEIAQSQDEKIEEVKMTCVSTMAECYDTQSSALKDFDDTTAKVSGALSAYAAKQMCVDKVSACAALFGNPNNSIACQFDRKDGKLLNADACGLTALVNFVNLVDEVRITEGCETALRNYAQDLCTATNDDMGYPWNCRLISEGTVRKNIESMSGTYCAPNVISYNTGAVDRIINEIVEEISNEVSDQLAEKCESLDGIWIDASMPLAGNYKDLTGFYNRVYNNKQKYIADSQSWGRCVENTTKLLCDAYNVIDDSKKKLTTYDANTDTCNFSEDWYKMKCVEDLGGKWENTTCYVK